MAGWREPHWPYRAFDQKPLSEVHRERAAAMDLYAAATVKAIWAKARATLEKRMNRGGA